MARFSKHEKPIEIGHIFSDGSYSGKESIQICGFDSFQGPWSCGCYEKSMDLCVKWHDIQEWLEKKLKEIKGENK